MGKRLNKIFNELYHTLCGEDNRLSLRRVMAVAIFVGIVRTVEAIIAGIPVEEWVLTTLVGFCLILLGIVASQSLIKSFIEKPNKEKQNKENEVH